MVVSEANLRHAVSSAKNISHYYQTTFIGADDPQRSVDYLIAAYQQYLGHPAPRLLTANDIDCNHSSIFSMAVLKENSELDIVLVKDLNHCWIRFTTAKELFHAILDKEPYQSLDLGDVIESYLTEFPNASVDVVAPPAAQVEFLAEIATMEFMFPYSARLREVKRNAVLDFREIATRYRIPQVKVEKFLSKEFMDQLSSYNQP